MADFRIGRIMNTFFVTPDSDAAKKLCERIIPSDIHAGADGALIFPPQHDTALCELGRAILSNGLSMEDMK